MKKKFFISFMVTAMLLTSVGVFAKTNSDTVYFNGGGYGVITVGISSDGWTVWADSTSYSAANPVISTTVEAFGGEYRKSEGRDHAELTGSINRFTRAESHHSFEGRLGVEISVRL